MHFSLTLLKFPVFLNHPFALWRFTQYVIGQVLPLYVSEGTSLYQVVDVLQSDPDMILTVLSVKPNLHHITSTRLGDCLHAAFCFLRYFSMFCPVNSCFLCLFTPLWTCFKRMTAAANMFASDMIYCAVKATTSELTVQSFNLTTTLPEWVVWTTTLERIVSTYQAKVI